MGDILIVDDERDIRELISDILQDEGFTTRVAGGAESCMKEIKVELPSLMILDIWLKDSDMDGIDILKSVKRDHPEVPIVIISGHGNIEIAVAAIKQGAYDFIEKPFNIDQLMVVIVRAMETSRLRRENSELRRQDSRQVQMIGSSTAFKALKSNLEKVSRTNSRVMLWGAAGSGKELAARYIHDKSERAFGPFISVNSAAVEPDQMEDLLFGRESSETGVVGGLLDQASGGTLYLDQVGDMPVGTQSKILRVLVDQQFTRVGGADKISVDVRVLSGTTKDLVAEIDAGNFRKELYHRLNVVPITVPSLADRREDIPELSSAFVEEFNRDQGLAVRSFDCEATTLLQTMHWPGNIRQLKNLVERVLILGSGDGSIKASELPEQEDGNSDVDRVVLSGSLATLPLREARELFEREYLMTQINRFGGNISRTANFVGMERSALHRKLKSLNVVTSSKAGARVAYVDESEHETAD